MRKRGDRAWWRWTKLRGERRLQVVSVIGGARSSVTLPRGSTPRQAAREVAILTAAITSGQLDAPASWDEAVDAFDENRARRGCRDSTRQQYRWRLQAAGKHLGDPDPLTLTRRDGEDYVRTREASAATIKGELDAVRIMQRWMHGEGWVPAVTWQDVRPPEVIPRQDYLGPEDLGAFLRAAGRLGERWETWPAAAWLLCHGLRTAEAHHLLVRDLDLTRGGVRIVDREGARTKNKASRRYVPILTEGALSVLRATFHDADPDAPAFPTGRNGTMAKGRTKWFERRCYATCAEAGIERVSPHALRHSVATLALESGADATSVSRLLGHRDSKITLSTYSHATEGALARSAAQLVGQWLDRVVEGRPVLEVL